MGVEVPFAAFARSPARIHEAADGASASRGIALRQRERRMDSFAIQRMGMGRSYRNIRGAFSDAEREPAGNGGAKKVCGETYRAAHSGRSDFSANRRTASGLQRVFN